MRYEIYLSPPNMGGQEQAFVKDAFDTNWIAPSGPSLDGFEKDVAAYLGVRAAVAVASGTAGIHLALRWLGIGQGDVVFCSDFTFAGSCNPILYQGAEPVFIDSEPESWNMSPVALEKAFLWAKANGKLPKAVIIVDLYGESADWDALLPICGHYGVPVIEDAAEALGTSYKGRPCGTFGHAAVLSFNGNKIITTSGGGMVLSDHQAAVDKMRFLSTQAREPFIHYEHIEYGYNYRMSNVCAAIGRGQMLFLEEKLARRREIYERYAQTVRSPIARMKRHAAFGKANCWLSLLVMDNPAHPFELVGALSNAGIESRPAWKPMHMQPLFAKSTCFSHHPRGFVSKDAFEHTVCLPSGDGMRPDQQQRVMDEINAFLAQKTGQEVFAHV